MTRQDCIEYARKRLGRLDVELPIYLKEFVCTFAGHTAYELAVHTLAQVAKHQAPKLSEKPEGKTMKKEEPRGHTPTTRIEFMRDGRDILKK